MRDEYQEILNFLKEKIKDDEIDYVLDLLDRILKRSRFRDQVIQLQNRNSSLSNKVHNEIISSPDANIEHNKIVNSLLRIIKLVYNDDESFYSYKKLTWEVRISNWKTKFFSLILILTVTSTLLGTGWFLIFFFQNISKINHGPNEYKKERIETESYKRFPVIGIDKNGNIAEYLVYISNDFNWKIGEDATSERFGMEEDICTHFSESAMYQKINDDDLQTIYVFGNASFEENLSIKDEKLRLKEEEDRADLRSRKLASCLNNNLAKLTQIDGINLGKYLYQENVSTYQRLILVIGLLKTDFRTNHNEALYHALIKEYENGNLEVDVTKYSRVNNGEFDIKRLAN